MTTGSLQRLLNDVPTLDGAACKGRPEVFDAQPPKAPDRDYLHLRARRICLRQCPALAQCRAWLDSLPSTRRPEGVVAGEFIESRNLRAKRRKTAAVLASHSSKSARKRVR